MLLPDLLATALSEIADRPCVLDSRGHLAVLPLHNHATDAELHLATKVHVGIGRRGVLVLI